MWNPCTRHFLILYGLRRRYVSSSNFYWILDKNLELESIIRDIYTVVQEVKEDD